MGLLRTKGQERVVEMSNMSTELEEQLVAENYRLRQEIIELRKALREASLFWDARVIELKRALREATFYKMGINEEV